MYFASRCIHTTYVVIRARITRIHARTRCVGPPEWADEWVSTEEKVSHMGASVPCNTSPTDGGDIRAADVQMKLTDWLRLNRLHILLRLRRTTSGENARPRRGGRFLRHQIISSMPLLKRRALRRFLKYASYAPCVCMCVCVSWEGGRLRSPFVSSRIPIISAASPAGELIRRFARVPRRSQCCNLDRGLY